MITVVTGNKNKAAEVAAFFKGVDEVTHIDLVMIEPQANTVEEIAKEKAKQAYAVLQRPLIVDDTGIFIESLNGFPGPYAAYVQDTIGNSGILSLMDGIENRRAQFVTAVAYADATGIYIFEGRIDGEVTFSEQGSNGFGYDPIFAVNGRTLSRMEMEEKNALSHRGRALAAFRDWYVSHDKRNG